MSMIKCPECGNDVSDKAEKCPHCGVSILGFSNEVIHTVELTSKKYKKRQLILRFAIVAGTLLLLSLKPENPFGIVGWILVLGGFVGLIIVRIKIWWNNK